MYFVKRLFLAEEYEETKSGLCLQNYDDDLSVVSRGFLVTHSFPAFFFVL